MIDTSVRRIETVDAAVQLADLDWNAVPIEDDIDESPWSQSAFRAVLALPHVYAFAAHVADEIAGYHLAGYVVVAVERGIVNVVRLAVAAEYQGQGVGTKLIQHVIDFANGRLVRCEVFGNDPFCEFLMVNLFDRRRRLAGDHCPRFEFVFEPSSKSS